jgi:hypothetical protein
MATAHGARSEMPRALTEGFSSAFTAGAGFAILGIVFGLLLIKGRPREDEPDKRVDSEPMAEAA